MPPTTRKNDISRGSTPSRASVVKVAAALAWMGVIFGLSSLPGSAIPGPLGSFAPVGHFILYAVLGALYRVALADRLSDTPARATAVALASTYGITDEIHQSFVSGRSPDPVDWLVDTIGAMVAVLLLMWIERRRAGQTPMA